MMVEARARQRNQNVWHFAPTDLCCSLISLPTIFHHNRARSLQNCPSLCAVSECPGVSQHILQQNCTNFAMLAKKGSEGGLRLHFFAAEHKLHYDMVIVSRLLGRSRHAFALSCWPFHVSHDLPAGSRSRKESIIASRGE